SAGREGGGPAPLRTCAAVRRRRGDVGDSARGSADHRATAFGSPARDDPRRPERGKGDAPRLRRRRHHVDLHEESARALCARRRGGHAAQPAPVRELRSGGTHAVWPRIEQPALLRTSVMLMTRAAIREDKCFDGFTEAILERDQPRTADLFFRMVARDGRAVGDALAVVAAAEAPFVQVPSHINVRDGQITLVNNDHTILGLRTSASLAPYLPERYRLLPL